MTTLTEGKKAPAFKGKNQDGKTVSLADFKGKNFVYTFDEHCPEGAHELIVTVEDLAGNRTEKVYRFTR